MFLGFVQRVGVEMRPEALAELARESWARGTPNERERGWLSGPVMSFGLLTLAFVLALALPSPERVSGRAVVRTPGLVHLRSEAGGGIRSVAVAPGDHVEAHQTLVELDNPEIRGELRRARRRYDAALLAMLRTPTNEALRGEVGNARVALLDLRDRVAALSVRSPIAGRVVSVRAHEGGLVEAADIVVTLADASDGQPSRPRLVATFPDATLGLIDEGTELELLVDRAGNHRHVFVVRSVGHEAVSIEDPLQRSELAAVDGPSSVLVVEAELAAGSPDAAALYDGMTGEVRALVRRRTLLERAAEAMGWRALR